MSREEWHAFDMAVLLEISVADGRVLERFEYVSPPGVIADGEPSILFKTASLHGDELLLCTQTEVLVCRRDPEIRVSEYISLPAFNDVHHVCASGNGTLLVANTGLDMVMEVARGGEVRRQWNTLNEDPWGRFSPQTDYRRLATTKPHGSHPNFVFSLDEDVWVTRFEQRDAICLTSDKERRISIGIERPHDGVLHGGHLYFTTVDGHVVIVDSESHTVEEVIDLGALIDGEGLPGWCRGILVVDGEEAWVGFTRLRPTRFRRNVSWVKHGFRRVGEHATMPTRISRFNLSRRTLEQEIVLEDEGLNAVFGILPGSQ